MVAVQFKYWNRGQEIAKEGGARQGEGIPLTGDQHECLFSSCLTNERDIQRKAYLED